MVDFSTKLNYLIENIRKPDGEQYKNDDIATLTGMAVSAPHLRKIRNGGANNPSYNIIKALTKFFHINANYWFDDGLSLKGYVSDEKKHALVIARRSVLNAMGDQFDDDMRRALEKVLELDEQSNTNTNPE